MPQGKGQAGGEDDGLIVDVSALWFALKNSNMKHCCNLKQALRFVYYQSGLHVASIVSPQHQIGNAGQFYFMHLSESVLHAEEVRNNVRYS